MSTLAYTYNLTNGTTADANEVMGNFNSVSAVLNGNIDSSNVSLGSNFTWTGQHNFDANDLRVISSPVVGVKNLKKGAYNIGFAQGADSSQLKITGANNAALSSSNPGYIVISQNGGQQGVITITSDITFDLTGAHWGLNGKGDITTALLRVYAIWDGASLSWGVGYQGGFQAHTNTSQSTSAPSITAPEQLLVTLPRTGLTLDVGYVEANFSDATNEWAITNFTHFGETADGRWQPWLPSYTGFSVNPSTVTARWTQLGQTVFLNYDNISDGTSNSVNFTMTAPIKANNSSILGPVRVKDNGVSASAPGAVGLSQNSTTITVYRDFNLTTWTNTGSKNGRFAISYEAMVV